MLCEALAQLSYPLRPSCPPPPPATVQGATPWDVAKGVVGGVALQLVLGVPFLLAFPASYLGRAFEFSRVSLLSRPGSF